MDLNIPRCVRSTLLRHFWIAFFTIALLPTAGSFSPSWPQHHMNMLQACRRTGPLGMISGYIRDWQITSSSTYPVEWEDKCGEKFGRVYQPNGYGWCAKYKSVSEWIQVDLGIVSKVTGVMTQGRNDGLEWVSAFMVSYSMDALDWIYVTDHYGKQKLFEGNQDSYSVKHNYLEEAVFAKFIKFHIVQWNRHPSMRVEVIGCQVCNIEIALPPAGKLTASSEKSQQDFSSCQASDAYIITNKGWCSKTDNDEQWLQYDVGPPTLITGVITRGRGDPGKNHWVTQFKVSYSNDSSLWLFYKERTNSANDKEFSGNTGRDEERLHYFNSPFVARFVRFHPIKWHRHIAMRAGLIGCPYEGSCEGRFMRITDDTPCVENLAYEKDFWINNRRLQKKRHIRNQWTKVQTGKRKSSNQKGDHDVASGCTILDNGYVEKPVWMVDLKRKVSISGLVIRTQLTGNGDVKEEEVKHRDYMHNLEKLVVYADDKGGKDQIDNPDNLCGFISRSNDALFRPKLHVTCQKPIRARYVYIEAWGLANSRLFGAILCDVQIYE